MYSVYELQNGTFSLDSYFFVFLCKYTEILFKNNSSLLTDSTGFLNKTEDFRQSRGIVK